MLVSGGVEFEQFILDYPIHHIDIIDRYRFFFRASPEKTSAQELSTSTEKPQFVTISHDLPCGWCIYAYNIYNMGVSKNMGKPPNHPFVHRVFHYFHHPF